MLLLIEGKWNAVITIRGLYRIANNTHSRYSIYVIHVNSVLNHLRVLPHLRCVWVSSWIYKRHLLREQWFDSHCAGWIAVDHSPQPDWMIRNKKGFCARIAYKISYWSKIGLSEQNRLSEQCSDNIFLLQ